MTGLFAGVGEPFVICGHTHMQFERHINKLQILSVGSVGMPYADQPGAYWLLIGPDGFAFQRTMYDLESAARDMEASGYPQAEEFVKENVLAVPTATEATEFLERLINTSGSDLP